MVQKFAHVRVIDPDEKYWLKFIPTYTMTDEDTGKKQFNNVKRARKNDPDAIHIYTLDVGSKGGMQYKLGWLATRSMLKKYKVGDVLDYKDNVPQSIWIEYERVGVSDVDKPTTIVNAITKSKYMKFMVDYVSTKLRKHGVLAIRDSFKIVPKEGGDFKLAFDVK